MSRTRELKQQEEYQVLFTQRYSSELNSVGSRWSRYNPLPTHDNRTRPTQLQSHAVSDRLLSNYKAWRRGQDPEEDNNSGFTKLEHKD